MRVVALACCLTACVHPAVRTPSALEITSQAHALLAAYDQQDEASLLGSVGETFAMFEGQELRERAWMLERMRARKQRAAPPVTRSWGLERVRVSPHAAVYIGESTEHIPAEADRPAREFTGFNTLVFAPAERGVWKAVHWAWEPAGLEGVRALWNQTYGDGKYVTEQPNTTLVDAIRGVKPGLALDLGSGQGRNAIYLASQGWQVTGVDISDVGHALAREQATRAGVTLDLVQANISSWDLGRERWDLVAMIYMGSEAADIRRAQASLKHGGLFVLSGFAPEPGGSGPDSSAGGALPRYFGPDFEILRNERVDGVADWGGTKEKLIHFVARKR